MSAWFPLQPPRPQTGFHCFGAAGRYLHSPSASLGVFPNILRSRCHSPHQSLSWLLRVLSTFRKIIVSITVINYCYVCSWYIHNTTIPTTIMQYKLVGWWLRLSTVPGSGTKFLKKFNVKLLHNISFSTTNEIAWFLDKKMYC